MKGELARQMRQLKRQSGGFSCPQCGHTTAVVDSRPELGGIKRRRGCPKCTHRFTTHELVDDQIACVKNDVSTAAGELVKILARLQGN